MLPAHLQKFGSHGSNVQIVSAAGSPFQQLGVETNQRLHFFESELRYPHRSNQQLDTAVLFGRTGINPAGELKRKSYLQ